MSAIPIPQPKPSGGRPPFEPPRTTTFDSSPGDGREPVIRLLTDSVKTLLKHLRDAELDQLPLFLRLVRERKALVENELRFERMMLPDTLPPLLKNMYLLEYLLEESDAVRIYVGLLEALHEAEVAILAKIGDQNTEAPASDL